jgi:hypothetical protein
MRMRDDGVMGLMNRRTPESVTLRLITGSNRASIEGLRVAAGQEAFVDGAA